jgi:O-antigen/teichoic acid export membrane protein
MKAKTTLTNTLNWSIKKQLAVNTLTNYIYLIVHLSCSLYLTRILYLNMDQQSYGFWQLLWVVFGFSLLLDFGFGVTIQKYTAAYLSNKDAGHLGEVFRNVVDEYLSTSY